MPKNNNDNKKDYLDIINHIYKKSDNFNHMSMKKRAAQFAPFAALKGHNDEIEESARFTNNKIGLDDEKILDINQKLSILKSLYPKKIEVMITYFKHDQRKQGGSYINTSACIQMIDDINKNIILANKKIISISDIQSIDSHIFNGLFSE
ncbi:MAG: hypothetical protein ACK5KQ_06035 [Anaerorhabdus sp.]